MSDAYVSAMQLLLADRPTRAEVEQSGQWLDQASESGHAEASERIALFEAMGIARQQSWERALHYLQLAARQGSRRAAEQLLLLANPAGDPACPDSMANQDWASIPSRIDVAARTTAPPKEPLSQSPHIRLMRGFATKAECRWLVELARKRLSPATVFDRASGGQTQDPSRDNSYLLLRLGEMNVFTEVIRARISAATRLPIPLFEPSQLLHYSVGQQFKPHHDYLDPANPAYAEDLARFGQRIATVLIYLNDEYEGGETSFPAIGLNFRARVGDALFFANVTRDGAPDLSTMHAGLPPTSGEKWVFSQWIRDRIPSN